MQVGIEKLIEEFKKALATEPYQIQLKNAELKSIAAAINYEVEKAKENGSYDLTPNEEKEIEAIKKYMLL